MTPQGSRDESRVVDFARPSIGESEIGEVLAALESGWLSTGPRVHAFERAFADRVGAPHAVAVNSCTAALHLALLASGIGAGPARPAPGTVHARHLYTVLVDPARTGRTRDALRAALGDRGVCTSVHFTALHLFSHYAERLGLRRGMFPAAEFVSDHTLSLPLSPAMTDEDVDQVVRAMRGLVGRKAA